MTKLTTQQALALAKLHAAQPFSASVPNGRGNVPTVSIIRTGVNTTVLHSMRELGLITCTGIYLRGNVTADLAITPAGIDALMRDAWTTDRNVHAAKGGR